MKKTTIFILAVSVLAVLLIGCGEGSGPASVIEDDGRLRVVSTIFAPFDFARAVAGDRAEVSMLLPPGSESHSFEPSPADILAIEDCDVFIYGGGESDEWVEGILSSIDADGVEVITLMDCVEVVEEELVDGMQEEEEEEPSGEAAYDEHVWTSPRNATLIVQKISDTLCALDGENAGAYEENTAAYLAALSELDGEFRAVVDGAARRTVVFGDRFPFRYLADAYGLTYFAAFPGCAAGSEASAATVAFLIDKVKAERIPVVFHIEMGNERMADTIAQETGARVLLLHACHNITKSDFEAGRTYLELMRANVRALGEALR